MGHDGAPPFNKGCVVGGEGQGGRVRGLEDKGLRRDKEVSGSGTGEGKERWREGDEREKKVWGVGGGGAEELREAGYDKIRIAFPGIIKRHVMVTQVLHYLPPSLPPSLLSTLSPSLSLFSIRHM